MHQGEFLYQRDDASDMIYSTCTLWFLCSVLSSIDWSIQLVFSGVVFLRRELVESIVLYTWGCRFPSYQMNEAIAWATFDTARMGFRIMKSQKTQDEIPLQSRLEETHA